MGAVRNAIRSHLTKAFAPAKVIKKTTGLFRSKRFHAQLLLPFSVTLVSLVIGALYSRDCPIEPSVPVFLIVQGTVGLIIFVLHLVATIYILYITAFKYQFIVTVAFLAAALILFLFGWFLAGNVWVFSIVERVQSTDQTKADSFCNDTVYRAAFALIIAVYVMSIYFCCSFIWIPQSTQSPTNGIIKVRKQIPKLKAMFKSDTNQPEVVEDIIETRH